MSKRKITGTSEVLFTLGLSIKVINQLNRPTILLTSNSFFDTK